MKLRSDRSFWSLGLFLCGLSCQGSSKRTINPLSQTGFAGRIWLLQQIYFGDFTFAVSQILPCFSLQHLPNKKQKRVFECDNVEKCSMNYK